MRYIFLVFLLTCNLFAGIGAGTSQSGLLPVELISFSSIVSNNLVVLNWTTATEINNSGFEIERAIAGGNEDSASWVKIGFTKGYGTSASINKYSFYDNSPINNKMLYRLKQIDYNGASKYSSVLEVESIAIEKYTLFQNYPNPFNPSTTISYVLPAAAMVTLTIYNVLGENVETIINENQDMGNYNLNYDASKLSAGIYFYKLKANNFVSIKKMVVLK